MAMNIYVSLKLVSGDFTWIYPDGDTKQLDYGEENPWAPDQPKVNPLLECVLFWLNTPGKLVDFWCIETENMFTICEH